MGRGNKFAILAAAGFPTIPRLFDGLVDAAPALPTARASALNEFRGSITRLWHPLPTLQDWCRHHPCKARFRLVGSPLPGGSRTLWIATKGFRSQSHPPFLDLSWRKGSFMVASPSRVASQRSRTQVICENQRSAPGKAEQRRRIASYRLRRQPQPHKSKRQLPKPSELQLFARRLG